MPAGADQIVYNREFHVLGVFFVVGIGTIVGSISGLGVGLGVLGGLCVGRGVAVVGVVSCTGVGC